MTCADPARILRPLRGQVVRRISDESSSLSVTFTVEKSGEDANRAFPFPVARHVPEASDANPSEIRRHDVLLENGGRNRGFEAGPWRRRTKGSSSEFLAGVMAQEWPGARLYNPQHQAAARAYRDVHSLGLRAALRFGTVQESENIVGVPPIGNIPAWHSAMRLARPRSI
jgi:hypothetical protein